MDRIRIQGPELLHGVTQSAVAVPGSSPTTSLPAYVSIQTPTSLAAPDYALACTSDESDRTLLLPVHGMVLSVHCKALALLSRPPPPVAVAQLSTPPSPALSATSAPQAQGLHPDPSVCLAGDGWSGLVPNVTTRNVPVVHIHVPSAHALSVLVPYFYTGSAASLLSSLLPMRHQPGLPSLNPAASALDTLLGDTPTILASRLSILDLNTLMQHVNLCHAVWQTAVALGAGRDGLWKTLDVAWSVLLGALAIKEGRANAMEM